MRFYSSVMDAVLVPCTTFTFFNAVLSDDAGVPDMGEAQTLLAFAKTYELIKKDNQSKLRLAEVDFSSADSLASEISRQVSHRAWLLLIPSGCMVKHRLLLHCLHWWCIQADRLDRYIQISA